MKYEEVVEVNEKLTKFAEWLSEEKDLSEELVVILKKRIPEKCTTKYVPILDSTLYNCPDCDSFVTAIGGGARTVKRGFCSFCGKAIKWDEPEEDDDDEKE